MTERNVIKSRSFAPVAQWTECRPPEPESAVRVCAGAPAKESSRRKAVFVLQAAVAQDVILRNLELAG